MNKILYFYPTGHEAHYEKDHPEGPERLEAIVHGLRIAGWWDNESKLAPGQVPLEILHTVHRPEYLITLQKACAKGLYIDSNTYTTPASWRLALQAAGGGIAVAKAVWEAVNEGRTGQVKGFALTRPPGHHATAEQGMGFCLLNNIAIAAEYLHQKKSANRIAIVDLDLHHGNGTQDIFWTRNDVLYISTHQSPLFPGSGQLEEIGAGPGEGYTVNLPMPPGTGDQGFLTVMEQLILPLLARYSPEIILVSVGFDPHWRDPLGHFQLSAATYGSLVSDLVNYADRYCAGRIAFFLEGGYDLEANAACAQGLVAAIYSLPWQDPLGPTPRFEGKSWQSTVRIAKQIWKL